MAKSYKILLACLTLLSMVTPPANAQLTEFGRSNFENSVRLNTKFYKTVYFSRTHGFTLEGSAASGNFEANINVKQTLGQNTSITIPDPGAAAANFVLDTGPAAAVTIQHVAVPLTAAQINGMYAAPVLLIAAGAAGTNIVVHHAMLSMTTTAIAFAGGGVVAPQIGNTIHGAGTATTATIAAAVVTAGAGTTYTTVIPVSYTSTAATGLYLSNQTAAFTMGTGTAIVDVWYSLK